MNILNKSKIFSSIDGLFAYDTGSKNSGIHDEQLRSEIISYLESLDDDSFRLTLSIFIREYFLSENQLNKGYGIEDVVLFIKWLDDFMGIEL